ncbi:heavy metal RND transporter [Methylacidiphilum sp. Yel]|jgi:cobalt-zinc-cadmium efflux system outer membrane protein|uniref:TolC family protein n=1 Tax=Methylacidiphilum sp. Yel TaxID=1847730 RepID=UPI00106D925F|nr:TolC family protein [Methylacidiphilum sp. Yel]TFE65526.1 heavy metal RND transporter [Methylacidiphilum sp. Yel]
MKTQPKIKPCYPFFLLELLVLCLCFFCLPFSLKGQSDKLNFSITIQNLIEEAYRRNPEILYYEAGIEAAKGQSIQAKILPYPEIVGYAGPWFSSPSQGEKAGGATGFYQEYEIVQPFFFPGKMDILKAISDKDGELARLWLNQFKLSLRAQVASLAYQLAVADVNAKATQEIVNQSKELIDFLAKRPKIGIQGLLDLRIIQGSLVDFQRMYREQEQLKKTVFAQLNAILGYPPEHPLPQNILPPVQWPTVPDLQKLLDLASRQNNFIKMRVVEIERAGKVIDSAKLMNMPDFGLGPYFIQEKGTNNNIGPGVIFTSGVPLWNQNRGNILSSEARKEQAVSMLASTWRMVQSAINSRLEVYRQATNLLAKQPLSLLEELRSAVNLAERQYRVGALPVQTFLEMQRQYLFSALTLRTAQIDAAVAFYDLQTLTGGEWSK